MRKVGLWVVLAAWAVTGFSSDFKYDSPVTIEGTLISGTADPSVTADEKPHQFPAIKLSAPINVTCDSNEQDCQSEQGISLLHLVLKQDQIEFFKKHKGNRVVLNGELFHSDNGNHFTRVLLDVISIK